MRIGAGMVAIWVAVASTAVEKSLPMAVAWALVTLNRWLLLMYQVSVVVLSSEPSGIPVVNLLRYSAETFAVLPNFAIAVAMTGFERCLVPPLRKYLLFVVGPLKNAAVVIFDNDPVSITVAVLH